MPIVASLNKIMTHEPSVAISQCFPEFDDEEIEEKVFKSIELIGGVPEKLQSASKILIKPNLGYSDLRVHKGRLVALTEPCVTAAVLRTIRDVNKERIILADGPYPQTIGELVNRTGYRRLVEEYDVELVDANEGPYLGVPVPGGGSIFREYRFNREIATADAVVSIAKMKSHMSTGVSLCMKNLFGLPPVEIYGWSGARGYLHYPIRLPRCLVDLTSIFKPSLNVIDGIVGENRQEWLGPPIESNVILTGNNPVATDAVACRVMGFDPVVDFPKKPFFFDLNHLKLASSAGLGPVRASEIKLHGEKIEDISTDFDVRCLGEMKPEHHLAARQKLMREARYYWENAERILSIHDGKIVGVQDERVLWARKSMNEVEVKLPAPEIAVLRRMIRMLTMKHKAKGGLGYSLPFIKMVVPKEQDPEIFEAYFDAKFREANLNQMDTSNG